MAEVALKIRIGNREYPLKVEESSVATIQEIAQNANKALDQRSLQLGITDMQDILAMTLFDCFVKQKATSGTQQTGLELDLNEVIRLNKLIEDTLQ
ncbi:MAG: cell division protein ZapA [Cytophagales bacterium]